MTKKISRSKKQSLRFDLLFDLAECRCEYCRNEITEREDFTIDHVVPISRGGANDHSNVVVSCTDCNRAKGSLLLTEFITKFNIKITRKIASFL